MLNLTDPSKPFQCDNFGDTTENAGRCSDVRDDTKAKKVKVCSQCPEKMSKESCNRACLDHSNRRTEMGCCAYEADTGYCFWDNEPLIEKNPGFTSVLCRKGIEGCLFEFFSIIVFLKLSRGSFVTSMPAIIL